MIVRRLEEIRGTDREVDTPNWVSRRFLLAKDGMGFSFHETVIRAGTETTIWYKHHLEAVYCVAGEGELCVLPSGPTYPIRNGTMYALNGHEKHALRATDDMRLVCVFNPPVTGREVHDKDGVYPALRESHADPVLE